MAHLLHDGGHHDDVRVDGCDVSGDHGDKGGCCDEQKHHRKRHCRHHQEHCHHHRKHKLIPVGNITVDCTPVTFRTPGQARNIVSCAVSQVLTVPVTRTTIVRTINACGCVVCTPVTETIQVPVVATVNLPPVLTPVAAVTAPQICPFPCPCPSTCPPASC